MENMPGTNLLYSKIGVAVPAGLGLHARPAARLATLAQQFSSEIWLSPTSTNSDFLNGNIMGAEPIGPDILAQDASDSDVIRADVKSIVDLLALAAAAGSILFLHCRGVDAVEAQEVIVSFFAEKGWQGE